MTYSQFFYRFSAAVIAIHGTYLLVSDRLCLLSKSEFLRPVHGRSAIALYLSILAIAGFLLVASMKPSRGARAKRLIAAWVAFIVLYAAAVFLDLAQR